MKGRHISKKSQKSIRRGIEPAMTNVIVGEALNIVSLRIRSSSRPYIYEDAVLRIVSDVARDTAAKYGWHLQDKIREELSWTVKEINKRAYKITVGKG